MLGFILRSTKDFKKSSTKIILFNLYVRNTLEYCSIVWNPFYQTHKNRLERVQKKMLRTLCYKDNLNYNYNNLLKHYKISSLSTRRNVLDLCFLNKIINGDIDCPDLVQKIRLAVPRNPLRTSSSKPTFISKTPRTNLGLNAPLNRILQLYNLISNGKEELDVFKFSRNIFKKKLKCIFEN